MNQKTATTRSYYCRMQIVHPVPTGKPVTFGDDEIIVSKTDTRGVITYANHVFKRVSGYNEAELIGSPHNILRHPEVPRCVFKLLWETIQSGKEIFAYINNLTKSGDHYWVFAHVTPSYDLEGKHVGYHSNRRVPYPDGLDAIQPIYTRLLSQERRFSSSQQGAEAGMQMLRDVLQERGQTYSQFVFSLSKHTAP